MNVKEVFAFFEITLAFNLTNRVGVLTTKNKSFSIGGCHAVNQLCTL